jgi:hypothetical protein
VTPAADSPEFARLVSTWIDGAATPDEAARLWEAIVADPACALEFAAHTRFDFLLEQTVRERSGASAVAGALTLVRNTVQQRNRARRPQAALLPLAAALVLLGLLAWLLWPHGEPIPMARTHPPAGESPAAQVTSARPAMVAHTDHAGLAETPAPAAGAISLPERLDRFFLRGVDLDQVPLQQALGLLQGQLLELNFLDTEALKNLRITLPTDAAGRRISFRSGPISFLKAVRAIAALGGCDLQVDEQKIALVVHREIYPQLAAKRDLRGLVAALMNAGGQSAFDSAALSAALMADAAALGIPVDPDVPLREQGLLSMTRGQWVALQALAEGRVQLGNYQAPAFQLYFTEGAPDEANRVIEQDEVPRIRAQLRQLALAPLTLVPTVPALSAPPGGATTNSPGLTVQPLGEVAQVTISAPSQVGGFEAVQLTLSTSSAVVRAGQGASLRLGTEALQNFAQTAGAVIHNDAASRAILLPVENPTTPP